LDELDSSQGQRVDEAALSAMGTSAIFDHVEQALERVKRAYH
jgi:hypothetical protein